VDARDEIIYTHVIEASNLVEIGFS